jgi:putative DNA primase/helicase
LPGKRFVMSSESGDTIRLHHDRIKQISGGDPIRAANKYEKSFEFEPTCKLWLSANRKPRVDDDSPAFWARVLAVPFPVSFVGRENRDLRPTLEHDPAHQSAVLRWLVSGAVAYYREGLHPPSAISVATADYQDESDALADFVKEALEHEPEAEVRASELYLHYCEWARSHHLPDRERMTSTMFGRRMSERLKTVKRSIGKVYLDVARKRIGGTE